MIVIGFDARRNPPNRTAMVDFVMMPNAVIYFRASETSLNFWMRFPVSTSAV